jgi:hypothetical protein
LEDYSGKLAITDWVGGNARWLKLTEEKFQNAETIYVPCGKALCEAKMPTNENISA